jgi:hypothetical protein
MVEKNTTQDLEDDFDSMLIPSNFEDTPFVNVIP